MDRMEGTDCIGCGGPLLDINSELRLCSQCEKKARGKAKQMVKKTKKGQRIKLYIPKLATK